MRVVCSYCGIDLGQRGEPGDDGVSHGMCQACLAHFIAQWDGLGWDDYLDRFAWPVLVVDPDVRILALNQPAEKLLGRPKERLIGLLGGEALECVYARLPGGCGRTLHCATCAVRRTITRTIETGLSQRRVPATLEHERGTIDLWIDTQVRDGVVLVQIEPA
ncbi:MAG: hypothetical protein ABIO70_23175 [Pseudomonadota bacterium]